jgi:hypothetical protein
MSLFEPFFKVLSLFLEARIRIHIKVKGRIRIRIKVTSRIRIRVKVMWIRNTGTRYGIGSIVNPDTVLREIYYCTHKVQVKAKFLDLMRS